MNTQNKITRQTVSIDAGAAASSIDKGMSDLGLTAKYEKPILIAYGDVRDVTLGPTPGLGESGCECARRDGAAAACPVVCPPGFP